MRNLESPYKLIESVDHQTLLSLLSSVSSPHFIFLSLSLEAGANISEKLSATDKSGEA